MEVRAEAFEMFAEGKKINTVATALLKGNWAKAKKLHEEWGRRREGGESSSALEITKARSNGDSEVPDQWDLTITVPTEKLNHILSTLSVQEKADTVQMILQRRFYAALGMEP